MIEQRTTRITKFRIVPWEDILWPSDGLVSWWKLNGNANDAWGSNHGTAYGVVWLPVGAGNFDGTDDYVDCGNDASLDITDEFTIEAWVKQDDISGRQAVWCGGNIKGHTKNYATIVGGKPTLDQYPPSGGYLVSSTVLTVGKWYHLVFVQTTSWRGIYINGGLDVSDTSPETYAGDPVEEWDIGRRYYITPFDHFNGLIDEVRIYNRALSTDEIKKRYLKTRIVPLKVGV